MSYIKSKRFQSIGLRPECTPLNGALQYSWPILSSFNPFSLHLPTEGVKERELSLSLGIPISTFGDHCHLEPLAAVLLFNLVTLSLAKIRVLALLSGLYTGILGSWSRAWANKDEDVLRDGVYWNFPQKMSERKKGNFVLNEASFKQNRLGVKLERARLAEGCQVLPDIRWVPPKRQKVWESRQWSALLNFMSGSPNGYNIGFTNGLDLNREGGVACRCKWESGSTCRGVTPKGERKLQTLQVLMLATALKVQTILKSNL